jgi:hypothetical protein
MLNSGRLSAQSHTICGQALATYDDGLDKTNVPPSTDRITAVPGRRYNVEPWSRRILVSFGHNGLGDKLAI